MSDEIVVENPHAIPPVRKASDRRYIQHVRCEGARFHVISYDSHGPQCSEPNCIINKLRKP